MAIIAPEYFHETIKSSKMKLDDVTFVEFKSIESEMKYEVCLKSNLLVFILQGEKIIKDLDREYRIKQGNGLFLKQNHYIMSHILGSKTKAYESFILMIDDQYLEDFFKRHGEIFKKQTHDELTNFCTFKVTPLIKAAVDSVFPYFKYHNKHTKTILRMKLDEMLINLIQDEKTGAIWASIKGIADKRSNDLKKYMELNYTKPWLLEEFALRSGRSLSTFKKEFKLIFKESPKKWINQKRLERARFLLNNSNYDVTEVSHLAGYSNLSYFIQLFKKSFDITPKQLQKN
ncbi:MAG: helix-turn-helix transcriptional regulator [Deltaproteobacteria bacterium]|nr:helix-turn-helix transcriptional regulator [Deltaproteobacteria bacterium]